MVKLHDLRRGEFRDFRKAVGRGSHEELLPKRRAILAHNFAAQSRHRIRQRLALVRKCGDSKPFILLERLLVHRAGE